jgi:hypothetical protein
MLCELPATKALEITQVSFDVRQPPRFSHVQRRFRVRQRIPGYNMVEGTRVE